MPVDVMNGSDNPRLTVMIGGMQPEEMFLVTVGDS